MPNTKHPLVRFIEWILNSIFGPRSPEAKPKSPQKTDKHPPPDAEPQSLQETEEEYPYAIKPALLTVQEAAFDSTLIRCLPHPNLHVHRQVRLADALQVIPGSPRYQHWFNRISAKSVDFLLCFHQRPIAIIELDDPTHRHKRRQERDAFLDAACAAAQLPILHVPTADSYDEQALRTFITKSLLSYDATLEHELHSNAAPV